MAPQYSIVLINKDYNDCHNIIGEWLSNGIKVFWFGEPDSISKLNSDYSEFAKSYLLNCYVLSIHTCFGEVIDGRDESNVLSKVAAVTPKFNYEQYKIEHCYPGDHIIVEASAGTGKTTVMIDRIMYLLHTVPNIRLADVAMITFTNEATAQMQKRLQEALLTRYLLTRNSKYLRYLEEQPNMQISTIDSFSFDLIKKCGVVGGFSQQLKIKSLNYERKELIKDILDKLAISHQSVISQFGVSYYQTIKLIDAFWNRVAELGLNTNQVLAMQWGNGVNDDSQLFQETLKKLIGYLAEEYAESKRVNDAVTIQELKRDIIKLLPIAVKNNIIDNLGFQYLFVDEFQDSDNSQIEMLGILEKYFNLKLFVVGDIKQSIYRFRGAVDSAFVSFEKALKQWNTKRKIRHFELINNYRTAPNVLQDFSRCFAVWSENGLLSKSHTVYPQKEQVGYFHILQSDKKGFDEALFISELKDRLFDFKSRYISEGRKESSRNRVVVLVRTNRQVSQIARLLDRYKIPVIADRQGSFYLSDAVKDFYAMISSFLYPNEPIYLFNYLTSSYVNLFEPISYSSLEEQNGSKEELVNYLNTYLDKTNWHYYAKKFRQTPVISVIKEILDNEEYINNYIARLKQLKESEDWDKDAMNASIYAAASQYKSNVEKILEILCQNFQADSVSVNKVVEFFRNAITTNREENEAEPDMEYRYDCVYCMTVHKAKGLEFDSVILPFTHTPFYYHNQTEILINNSKTRIAWNVGSNDTDYELQNNNYYLVRKEEDINAAAEETRILYVAMTRTIHSFSCIMGRNRSENCWSYLFEKVEESDA